jgi:hypothetical protein
MPSPIQVCRQGGLAAILLAWTLSWTEADAQVPSAASPPSALATRTDDGLPARLRPPLGPLKRRIRRTQTASGNGSLGEQGAVPGSIAPSASQLDQSAGRTQEDVKVPRAERGEGGTEPTVAEKEKQAPAPTAAPAAPTPLYLNRLLGMEEAPFRVYGWLQNGFTGNANGTPANRSNFSVFPNRLANQWQGNQYYLVLENPLEPDDMMNFGFRFDTLFGNDWQFTKSYGLFDRAFANNHSAVPAISRPFYSVPYSMNFTPFTFLGMVSTFHLTDRINVYNGTINGWDRWIDESYKWGYLGFVTWKSRDEKTNVTFIGAWVPDQLPRFAPADSPIVPTATTPPSPVLAGRQNPFYASSYRNFYSFVVTHQWTDKLTEVAETDHVYDPKIVGFSTNGKPSSIYYAGMVHWFVYNFTDKLTGAWRSEIFWDPYGAATGSRSTFYEFSLALTHKPKPWIWIRPEARYDWSQFTHPFNDGTRSSQLTLAISTILLF